MSLTISRLTPGTLRIKATTTVATANHATRFAARSTRNCITSLPTARLDASRSNWECRSPGILSSDTAVSNRSFVDGNRTDRHHCVVSSVFSGALFASAEFSAVQRPLRPMVDYMCALDWMAQNRKQGAWSYKGDRRLLELAKHSRPAEEIANLMNRSPDAIRKMAIRLGVSLNKNRRQSAPARRPKANGK